MARTFHVLIEKDEDGGYIGKVPELKGCLCRGNTGKTFNTFEEATNYLKKLRKNNE